MTCMNARSVTSCIGARAVNGWPAACPGGRRDAVVERPISTSGFLARSIALFGLLLEHPLEDLGHVLDRIEYCPRNIDWALLLERQNDGVARTGVEFDDLLA